MPRILLILLKNLVTHQEMVKDGIELKESQQIQYLTINISKCRIVIRTLVQSNQKIKFCLSMSIKEHLHHRHHLVSSRTSLIILSCKIIRFVAYLKYILRQRIKMRAIWKSFINRNQAKTNLSNQVVKLPDQHLKILLTIQIQNSKQQQMKNSSLGRKDWDQSPNRQHKSQ